MNRGTESAIKRGAGRQADAQEAMAILRLAEEVGRGHLTANKARIGIGCGICSRSCPTGAIRLTAVRGPAFIPA
jgi:ferredoxin